MSDTFEGKQLKALPFLLQTNHYLSLIRVAVARRICNEVIFFQIVLPPKCICILLYTRLAFVWCFKID